jgi:6,7-dimethyl-8-ribityllumazine synthase
MAVKTKPPTKIVARGAHEAPQRRILIVEGRFYDEISDELANGAIAALKAHAAGYDRISVPGALEIPQALAHAASAGLIPRTAANGRWDGAVALGCVIRGETSHYDIVCSNANHWLMEVAIRNGIPLGNGILTVDTEAQALARARGGENGKGGDAVRACLSLIELAHAFEGQSA